MQPKSTISPHVEPGRRGGTAPHKFRTHWTRGKRRHDPGPFWPRTLVALKHRLAAPVRGSVSREALARFVGVDARTVRRWLEGTDLPSHERVERIRAWLKDQSQPTRVMRL